jgi:hypothetical protein
MKQFLCLLFCLVFFQASAGIAQEEKPFIAVFCNPDPNFMVPWRWYRDKIDMIYKPQTWDDLHPFLQEVKKRAGSRKIVLDIDVHGSKEGYLYLQYDRQTPPLCKEEHKASVGYVLNKIEEALPGRVQEVDLEACFAGIVYKKSIRNNPSLKHSEGDVVADHYSYPPFPVYGVRNFPNYMNSVFIQRWIIKTDIVLNDLRKYEFDNPGKPKMTNLQSVTLYRYLRSEGLIYKFYADYRRYRNNLDLNAD